MRSLLIGSVVLLVGGCVSSTPDDPTERTQLSGWTVPNSSGFALSDIQALPVDTMTTLSWHGGGPPYEVSPSSGTTELSLRVSSLGAPTAVDPCPDNPVGTQEGNVDACATYIEADVLVEATTSDGALHEAVTCPLLAYGATDWRIVCPPFETVEGTFRTSGGHVSVSLASDGAGSLGSVYVSEAWSEDEAVWSDGSSHTAMATTGMNSVRVGSFAVP